jgi:hypothetical protein
MATQRIAEGFELDGANGAYELVLCFDDGHEEVRLTDHLDFLAVGGGLAIRDGRWRVVTRTSATEPGFAARLVCRRVALEVVTDAPPAG